MSDHTVGNATKKSPVPRLQLQPCRLPTGSATKNSSSQIAVVALSPSNWACPPKSQVPRLQLWPCRLPTGPTTKNLEFPDCSCSPVAFQLGLPPNNLKFPDCSCSPVAFQLSLLFGPSLRVLSGCALFMPVCPFCH